MPHRLDALVRAIDSERDPVVRGRVAALLLCDLADATTRTRQTLDEVVGELKAGGCSEQEVARLLGIDRRGAAFRL